MSNADCPWKPTVSGDCHYIEKDADALESISSNKAYQYEMNDFGKNRTEENAEKISPRDTSTGIKCQSRPDDRKSVSRSNSSRIQDEKICQTITTSSTSDVPRTSESNVKDFTMLCHFDSPLYTIVALLMVGMHNPRAREGRPVPQIVLTSPGGTETEMELPPTPPLRDEVTREDLITPRFPTAGLSFLQGPCIRPHDFISTDFRNGVAIQRGPVTQCYRSPERPVIVRGVAKSPEDIRKQLYTDQKDLDLQGAKSQERPLGSESSDSSSTTTTSSSEDHDPNENHLPESIFNPKDLHSREGSELMPIEHDISKNRDDPMSSSTLEESDPCWEAMTKFENVYGQYVHCLEKRVSRRLSSMQEFIAEVRKNNCFVHETGAILSKMEIPPQVRSKIKRINELIEYLTHAKSKLENIGKHCCCLYLSLKYRPLHEYRGASRIDEINALKNETEELAISLAHTIKMINSYPALKRSVAKYVFDDGNIDILCQVKNVLENEESL